MVQFAAPTGEEEPSGHSEHVVFRSFPGLNVFRGHMVHTEKSGMKNSPGGHTPHLFSSNGACPGGHETQFADPDTENWDGGHGIQKKPLWTVPGSHRVQPLPSRYAWPWGH
ncbi:GCC2 and GCC3 domain containing protein [Gracilaria domingensis]|nr:GCC2 and GCC3 domain containing protein [Gracilaria domingensis]